MHIAILGSGVIGTTLAWYLTQDGHQVTVLDRQPGAGLETSFANAGEISPGYSSPWAAPGIPLKAIKWLFSKYSPLVIRPQADPAFWRWTLAMLSHCNAQSYITSKTNMVRLAEFSRDCLRELRAETGIAYDERTRGTLQLFRTQQQIDGAAADIEVLRRFGVAFEVLDRAGCVRHEPALARVADKFVGGLLLPGDETGDCHLFTQRLAAMAAARGAEFRYGVDIHRLNLAAGKLESVETSAGTVRADAYVMALGSYSTRLLKPLGIRLPVYPVKGYSLTLPITDASGAPESTVMDETYKVAVTRLGDRVRVGGTAELTGYDLSLSDARRATLAHVVRDLFPDAGEADTAEFWTGLRPMTPDGPPILGASGIEKLHLATGHGTLGWTMAAGTGRLMAELIGGRSTSIDPAGLGLDRYRRAATAQAVPSAPLRDRAPIV